VLADVAPTILELAGLEPWSGMTGTSLLEPCPA
jgi:bisphosphoglycerate-independent phosphoglycerate mutase (AlkP superfamily)